MDERIPEKTKQEAAPNTAAALNISESSSDRSVAPSAGSGSSKPNAAPVITDVRILNPRSLRVEFSNGAIRLFDRFRLRGPRYIPLIAEENFMSVTARDGDLYWEALDITCPASYVYRFSVPYDDNATAREYVRTRRDIIQERIAIILFPAMAIAGIIGTVWWWINN